MNTNEVDEKDTLNTNQDGHEGIVNAEPATEMEMENKMADEIMAETTGVIDLMKKVQDELETMKDKFLRLNAEFDNYKRRTLKERVDLLKSANADVMVALLPVLDDFERAMKSLNNDENNAALDGVSLIHSKFKSILDQKGLKAMNSIGKAFDVELHDAITQVPATDEKQKDTVMDEVERGYFLNDKVIRHAKVVVYN